MSKKAIIIGAGPAGLTAAHEFLKRTDIVPVILEKSGEIGGISRTINYKGNRMDMGPHRFFSKSDRVMNWWLEMMPLEESEEKETVISYQNKTRRIKAENKVPKNSINAMLVIRRFTRIYFLRKFFTYPIQLSLNTLRTLGLIKTIRIIISFGWIRFFPRKSEISLEDFIINRFGKELYILFFKDYTEKVWGIPPCKISAEWGAQRIKGVSLTKAIREGLKILRSKNKSKEGLWQRETETSLIEHFMYPKYGPGSFWEEIARQVVEMGGEIHLHQDVKTIYTNSGRIHSINTTHSESGEASQWEGEYFLSTMPVQELIAGIGSEVPAEIKEVAAGLQYRDFINVGILLKQLSTPEGKRLELKDNWIYIQERDVKVGRLMIYNNWGGSMINDPSTTWIGIEYFCNKTDDFWAESDEAIQIIAIKELEKMELARREDVLDSTVRRMEKTYPAYFGTYNQFDKIRAYTDSFENLFLVGRNGMHKYNNADHSMLTAMVAVDNIQAGILSKENIWSINTEQEYHEEKKESIQQQSVHKQKKEHPSFIDHIWNNRWNRAYVLTGIFLFVLQFFAFKIRYPFANYMPDSYGYLEAAFTNADVNTWPVAYSKFIRLISVFTHSDKVLVTIQYLFMQGSALVFLFVLDYLIQPGKAVKFGLFIFFVFNPITVYVANYISADALFYGFSCLWISSLIWIIYKPKPSFILVHGVLLLICFTLRYNAIYYPLIAMLAFLLSRLSWKIKLTGIVVGSALITASILFTTNKMFEVTGKKQFSAFGGWQLANNALYMYEKIPAANRKTVPSQFAGLETMVRQHLDTAARIKKTREDSLGNIFYLWSGKAPLIQYMVSAWKKDSTTDPFKRWASEGPLYEAYGGWLIKTYPIAFLRDFVWPNAMKYLLPPPEFLSMYNMGSDSVGRLAKEWFKYRTQKVIDKDTKRPTLEIGKYYSVFSMLANVFLLMSVIGWMFFTWFRTKDGFNRLLCLIFFFCMLNACFSMLASPIVLRYQVFPVLISFTMSILVAERIYKWGLEQDAIKNQV